MDEALKAMRTLLSLTDDPDDKAQIEREIEKRQHELRRQATLQRDVSGIEAFGAERITELLEEMKALGGFREVRQPREVSDPYVTYAVVQAQHLLTIGSGENKRLKVLMGNSGVHNKAPLIGLCHRLFSEPIRFFVCRYTRSSDKNCSVEERALQTKFGETNVHGHKSYREAMRHLRGKLGIQSNAVENILLDLMETHGDVLKHALATESTAATVERLFNGYWKKSRTLED